MPSRFSSATDARLPGSTVASSHLIPLAIGFLLYFLTPEAAAHD